MDPEHTVDVPAVEVNPRRVPNHDNEDNEGLEGLNRPVYGPPEDLEGYVPNPAGSPPFPTENTDSIPISLFAAGNEDIEAHLRNKLQAATNIDNDGSINADNTEPDPQFLTDHNLPSDSDIPDDIYASQSVRRDSDNTSDSLDNADLHGFGQTDSMPLSKEEKDRLVQQCLDEDIQENINTQTLLFDYGPFHGMEKEMGEFVRGTVEPAVADVVMSHVRQAIHDAVSSHKNLQKEKNSDLALFARIDASDKISGNIKANLAPLLSKLQTLHVEGSGAVGSGLDQIVQSTRKEFELKAKTLQPASLGGHLFNQFMHQIAPAFAPGMTGNARKHRNKELTSSLSDLFIVADEIKKNAGNLDWEKSHGSICTQAVNNLTKRIHSLTKGVEGQIDSVSLNKGLKDIHKVLGEAAEASADPEHKNRLTEVKEFMDFVAKAIAEAFAKIFGKDAGPGRAKPSM